MPLPFFQTPSKIRQRDPKIFSNYFKNEIQMIPEIPRITSKIKPKGFPIFFQTTSKTKLKHPRHFFKLLQKPDTNIKSPSSFKLLTSKIKHTNDLQDSFKLLQKPDIRGSRNSFKLLQKQNTRVLRFFQTASKIRHKESPTFFQTTSKTKHKRPPRFFQMTSKTRHKRFPRFFQTI